MPSTQTQRKLLIPFFTAGFPNLDSAGELINNFAKLGSDYIEIGLPHSDALADGPVIQNSSGKALDNGMNIELLFEQVSKSKVESKLILFTYFNPILAYGPEKAAKAWKAAGGSAILIPDLPFEEATLMQTICKQEGLKLIFLIAPTSTPERIKSITQISEEFIYLVSLTGVTGVRSSVQNDLSPIIRQIKNVKNIPVVVGFGIGSTESAQKALSQGADGVVVGSAIVKLLAENKTEDANNLLAQIRTSLDLTNS